MIALIIRTKASLLVVCFILLLVSCNEATTKAPSLTLTPTTASANAGAAPVTFKATLTNTSGEVSWTLSPTLGTLSSTTGLETNYTPPASVTTQTDVTLTASLGNLSAKAILTLKPTAQTLTVTGKVLGYNGEPGAFLPIAVAGQKTATDASGNFSVSGVTSPYDLVVLQASTTNAYIYQGLTRSDPIALIFLSSSEQRKSEVTYSFSNADTTAPPAGEFGDSIMDCASTDASLSCGVTGAVGPNPYTQTVQWSGPQNIEADVYALQTFEKNNIATAFRRFALTQRENFSNGQPSTVSLNLQPISSGTVSGTVTPPSDYTLIQRGLGFKLRGQWKYPFSLEDNRTSGISQTFSWASPVVAGLELYLNGTASKGEAGVYAYLDNVAPNTTNLSLTLPAPPEQTQPATNALGITNSTVFSWTPFAEGVHTVSVSPTTKGPLTLIIYTAKTETTLPDLTSLGYPLPKGVTYKWRVSGQAPLGSVDDLAKGVSTLYPRVGYSGERTFTTTP
jgi:hypothetical protein